MQQQHGDVQRQTRLQRLRWSLLSVGNDALSPIEVSEPSDSEGGINDANLGRNRARAAGADDDGEQEENEEEDEEEDAVCTVCGHGDDADFLLLCDGHLCNRATHTFCTTPATGAIPDGIWLCSQCKTGATAGSSSANQSADPDGSTASGPDVRCSPPSLHSSSRCRSSPRLCAHPLVTGT